MLKLLTLQVKFLKFIFLIIFIFFFNQTAFAEIKYIDTTAKGTGETFEIALKKAFNRAVSKVNGVSVESESVLKTIDKSVTTNEGSTASLTRDLQQTINEKTKGSIKTFEILSESKDSNGLINIEIKATIAKFALSKSAKRKRIAVVPFRLNVGRVDLENFSPDDFRELLNQKFSTYLVQTRKFTVLDREYMNDMNSELNIIKTNQTNIEETVKLGQKLFSDYIMVGTLQKLYTEEKTIKIKNSNNSVTTEKAFIEFSYRIIDVPTSQIMFSDDYTGIFDIEKKDMVSLEGDIIKKATLEIGSTILNAIYPLRIEKISGDIIYIGQGGLELKVGDEFTIIELGEKIKDSYTNEYIGREQKEVGKLEITQVNSKTSSGKILEQNYVLEENFEPKKYILRKIITNVSDIDIAKDKINAKKEEGDTDDDW